MNSTPKVEYYVLRTTKVAHFALDMSVPDSRSTYYFRSELARNRSSPARLRGGWGLAGAGAGVP